jgi:hypothetical protein
MSTPKPSDTTTTPESGRTGIYDTAAPTGAGQGKVGVYDAPERRSGPPLGMIIGIVVALLVLAFLLVQFVF